MLLQDIIKIMKSSFTISEVRVNLNRLVNYVCDSHNPIHIHNKHANAVLISEEDWHSIQETLYLISIPEMRKKIREGMKIPLKDCINEKDCVTF